MSKGKKPFASNGLGASFWSKSMIELPILEHWKLKLISLSYLQRGAGLAKIGNLFKQFLYSFSIYFDVLAPTALREKEGCTPHYQ